MKKVLLSAFACNPLEGSEPGNGWNWATGLALEGYEVHCLTRGENKQGIEQAGKQANIYFHYISLPGIEFFYLRSQATMYIYYILWQVKAYLKGKALHKKLKLDVVHHVTWGSTQMGSFLYKLKVPFIFGPAGGAQKAPEAFKKYFLDSWASEIKRDKIGDLLVKYNPGFNQMVKKAHAVISSNIDTIQLVKANGGKNVFSSLDAALPESFFPKEFNPKSPKPGQLKLLWIGRFMPRKGVLLLLDVMNELKNYPGITLTVVGDGEMKNAIVNKVKEYQLESTVTLTGKVPFVQVREFYISHHVFFYTSLRDSCPAQLMEAGAFGLPVVTINLHGQALIVNDKTGVVCDCDTPEIAIGQLKNAIIDLYNHPDKVTSLSTAAYEFANQQTWKIKINKIVSNYYPI
jgi:glycosyltransferase involved in cell wall biosynthesis